MAVAVSARPEAGEFNRIAHSAGPGLSDLRLVM